MDEFGGSFENRMRLPKLIIENIRKKAGDSLAILCRINEQMMLMAVRLHRMPQQLPPIWKRNVA